MPLLAIKLFFGSMLKRAIGAATALFGIISRYPWQAAVIALLAVSALLWRGKANALDERDAARAETAQLIVTYRNAQKEAEAAQIAANKATEARYSAIAKETNHDYQIALGDAQRRASDYISRMRIKTLDRSPRAAFTAPADNGPGVPADPAANTELVAVKPDDINACTVDHEYALGAYKWGQSLVKDGLALPEVGF